MPSKKFRTNALPQAAQNREMDRQTLVSGVMRGIEPDMATAGVTAATAVAGGEI
jgi:hypothetical protein